jgi:MFS family permease
VRSTTASSGPVPAAAGSQPRSGDPRAPLTDPQPKPAGLPAPDSGPQVPPAGHRGPALALILDAAFMVVLDFSIVNVALPSIQRELGFAGSSVQWIVTGYAIAFGGLLILGGRAADLFGRRRMFMAGLLAFSAASLAGGLAHDPVLLVASRFVQGAGALLVTAAVAALVFAVSQVDALGWGSPAVLAALALAAASVAAFVAAERYQRDPLVRPGLLRMPGLRTASTMNALLGLWNAGEMIVLSLYFQQVLHDSALATGLAIAPQGAIGFTAGVFGARLASRVGIRRVLVLTSAVATVGFLVLTRLPASGGYSPLLAAVMLVGFGTAGTAFGTMVTASHGVADQDQGLVGGVINTSRQVGAAIGAALLPAVAGAVNHSGRAAGAGGDRAAMLAGAVAAALALAVALRAAGGPRPHLRHS